MNRKFSSLGEELAEKIHESPNPFMRDKYTVNERNLSFHFYEINDHHIGDAIPKIKTSKGFENDNVSSYFLKIALPHIKNFLVYMFKKYIEKGLFPALCSFENGQSYPDFQR